MPYADPEKRRTRERERRAAGLDWNARHPEEKLAKERARHLANPEKRRAIYARYRERHPEAVKARTADYRKRHPEVAKAWLKAHPESRKATHKKYRTANSEKVRKREAAYRSANPERVKDATSYWRKRHPDNVKAQNARSIAKRKLDPEKYKAITWRSHLKKTYGITPERFEGMVRAQGGVCAICKEPERGKDHRTGVTKRLYIDHCHKTGKVRGLLCNACNRMLGYGRDRHSVLAAAAKYLKRAQRD